MLLTDHLNFDAKVQAKDMIIHTLAKASEPAGVIGQVYTDITNSLLMIHLGSWKTVATVDILPTQYTDEMAQDAINAMLVDTTTINFTYTDATPELKFDVITQMSITSDASGVKLSGDVASPGNTMLYGTNASGTKGWYAQPSSGTGNAYAFVTADTGALSASGSDTLVLTSGNTILGIVASEITNDHVTFTIAEGNITHANLGSLQGGTTAEYYHLTSAQHTIATQAASTTLSGYLTNTDWNTFNGKEEVLTFSATSGLVRTVNAIALDFTKLTNETTLADADEFAFYDSAVGMRALTYAALKTALNSDLTQPDLTFDTAGTTGTGSVSTSQTFTISGTANQITTAASAQSLTIGFTTDVTMPGNLTVTGDLTVNGTTTTVNTATLIVEDPLIKLGNANDADSVDLGLFWEYNTVPDVYGGIFRDASDTDKAITFFEDNQAEPTTTVNTAGTGYALADVKFGTVRAGTWAGTTIGVAAGGTAKTSFIAYALVAGGTTTTGALQQIAVGSAVTGSTLRYAGASALATWSPYSLPGTVAQYDLLYASTTTAISALAKANYAVLTTGSGGLPAWKTMSTNGQLLIGGTSGPVAAVLTEGTGITITNGNGTITIAAATGTAKIASALLGDGDAQYTWNHGLALAVDTDIVVQVWGVAVHTDKQLFPSVTVVDGNNITFDFGFNVTAGDFKAVLTYKA